MHYIRNPTNPNNCMYDLIMYLIVFRHFKHENKDLYIEEKNEEKSILL